MIRFDWDSAKATANLRKHGVSLDEAQSVFHDEFAGRFFDEEHATDQGVFLLLGMSTEAQLLLVCHCEHGAGVPYQSLINLYLRDCVTQHRQVKIAWPTQS
jgi:uncharacterized DUF497 family protein